MPGCLFLKWDLIGFIDDWLWIGLGDFKRVPSSAKAVGDNKRFGNKFFDDLFIPE